MLNLVVAADAGTLLGKGIYDVHELARLVRRGPDEIAGWTSAARPLLFPQRRRVFSFHDLVTAAVVAELRRRSVPLVAVQDARDWLADELEQQWPLAHAVGLRRLASVGRDVYFRDQERWLAASRGGQLAFEEVVEPLIRHLQFDAGTNMAVRWTPSAGVLLDPAVQAGAPCIRGTRLTTELISDLFLAGEDPADIAEDFKVELRLIRDALRYEELLAA